MVGLRSQGKGKDMRTQLRCAAVFTKPPWTRSLIVRADRNCARKTAFSLIIALALVALMTPLGMPFDTRVDAATTTNVAYVYDFGSGVNDSTGPGSSAPGSNIFRNAITGGSIGSGNTGNYNGAAFTNVPLASLSNANALNGFDTVLLYQTCSIGSNPAAMAAVNAFLDQGGKVIIIDGDACAPPSSFGGYHPADWSTFRFPFATNNPGPVGNTGGAYTKVDPSTLTTGLPTGTDFGGDGIGDANIFTSNAGGWCESIRAKNGNGVEGFVEAYARTLNGGLVIYEGEDFWYTDGATGHLKQVYDLIQAQTYNPDGLPCNIPATGIKLDPPTQTHNVGASATVTATVVDNNGTPLNGTAVTFGVTSGPDAGKTGSGTTDSGGHATFAFSDTTTPGTDLLVASFTDGAGTHPSNEVKATWVAQPTTLTYTGDTTQDFNDPATLAATLTTASGPVAGQTVKLQLDGQSPCTGVTNTSGKASCAVTPNEVAGVYTVTATFDGSGGLIKSSTSAKFTVTLEDTALAFTPTSAITGDYNDSVTLSARLTDKTDGSAIVGAPITLTIGTQTPCSATTDAAGVASCSITPNEKAASYTLTATYAGDSSHYAPSSASGTFVVTLEETTLKITSSNTLATSAVNVSAVLKEDGTPPIAGRTVTFSAGSATATGTTDASGVATATLALAPGAYTLTASFTSDGYYKPATDTQTVYVYQPTQFVIWGGNAPSLADAVKVGQDYKFWGAQWAKQVTAGDFQANNSFKGYAEQVSGKTWTSDPGNSSDPPASVASYISVIVTTHVAKKGPVESGDIVEIVVLKVDDPAGYQPNPGHSGTGVMVAIVH